MAPAQMTPAQMTPALMTPAQMTPAQMKPLATPQAAVVSCVRIIWRVESVGKVSGVSMFMVCSVNTVSDIVCRLATKKCKRLDFVIFDFTELIHF